MNSEQLAAIITDIGFPIASVIALAWFGKGFVSRVMDESKAREERSYETIEKLNDSLRTVADTTESTSIQLNRLCDKMDILEDKVSDLENNISR